MSGLCFICKDPLPASENVIVHRGMKTLIDASAERGDEFTDYLKSQKSVAVHVQCRKNYTRRSTIAAMKRQHEEDQASTSQISPPRTRACELLIVEESEQTESNHGVGPHFAKFRESTEERPLESPIPHELNTERPLSRESSSRKRTESNADPLSDSISTCKRQRRLQNSTVASKHTEEDFTLNKDRSNEAAASEAVESDLYGQLLAQKLKPLDVEDRLVLMNDIDNLVFKHLMNITKRNKMFRSAELQSTIQGHSDNRQFTDLSGSYSRLNQIQNESQNVMQNSQHEMPFMVLKTEAE